MKYRDENGVLHDNVIIKGESAYQSYLLSNPTEPLSETEFYEKLGKFATTDDVEAVDSKLEDKVGQLSEEIADQFNEVDEKIKNIDNLSIIYRNVLDTDGVTSNGSIVYYDRIDRAWLNYSKREPYDENRKSNYYVLVKEKADGSRIYTKQSVFDGTDFPIKSGTLNVTDIKRWSNYYLVTVRSAEANIPSDGVDNTSIWGYLLVLNADDLSVNTSVPFNAKCSNVNVISTKYMQGESFCFIMVSCQMSYFQIAKLTVDADKNVSVALRSKTYFKAFKGTSYADIHEDIQEFQVGKFYISEDNTTKLLISAGFGDGIHIVDVSSVGSTGKYTAIYNYNWLDHLDVVGQDYSAIGVSSKAGATFDLEVRYPYVYATFAQPTEVLTAYNEGKEDLRVQGLLVLDISDLNNIVGTLHKIPTEDLQSDTSGDPKPCTIKKYADCVYLGMGDKGVAKFKVDGMSAEYKGNIKVGNMKVTRYIDISDGGELYAKNFGSGGVPTYNYPSGNLYQSTIIELSSIKD